MSGRTSKTTLESFTEAAITASLDGKLIPPVVYIPASLRKRKVRLRSMTLDAPDVAENQIRVAQADPTGFLIAVMQGQPIPAFRITRTDTHYTVTPEFLPPDMANRVMAAKHLAYLDRLNKHNKQTQTEYETMIKHAAAMDDGTDAPLKKREKH